ncbi:MAG: hypothetical protein SGILL_000003 [Bacillariaceae sp.]
MRACSAFSAAAPPNGGRTGLDKLDIQPLQGGPQNLISLKDYISKDKTLFVFGTYAADFNALEYAQRLRYYLPILERDCGITKFGLLLNCEPEAAVAMADLVDLDTSKVDVFVDNTGAVGKEWGVGRGWLAGEKDFNPYLKLFGMLWGLGAWATLPAVIGGYIGNPFTGQPWIEDALAVGTRKGRFPTNALEMSENGEVLVNKFRDLPLVGKWPRRPLELATLRLQSMMGISLKEWEKLAPNEEALASGVLTQLGGCVVVDGSNGEILFEWKDPGICAVANFEDILDTLKK